MTLKSDRRFWMGGLMLLVFLWGIGPTGVPGSGTARAAESTDTANLMENLTVLDLQSAARISLAENPSLAAAQARLEQARELVNQARSTYWPRLDASASVARVDMSENSFEQQAQTARFFGASIDDPEDYYRASLTASWLVFDGFARKFNLLSARYGSNASAAARTDAHRLLLSAVTSAFLSAQQARENILIAEADLEFNQRLLTEARLRYDVGTGALSDVLNFQVRANDAKTQRIQAEQNFKASMIGLAALLGLPKASFPENMRLAELDPAASAELEQPIPAEQLETAYSLRPDLEQVHWAVQSADAGVGVARSYYYPTLQLSASYDGERADSMGFSRDDFGNTVALSLSYNIFAGGLYRSRVQEAKWRLIELEKNYESTKLDVTSDVLNAITNVRAAQEQLELQQDNTQLVQRNRDLVEKEYKAGVGSLVRLNEAQRDLIATQVRLAAARVSLRRAWYDLKTATGTILKQFNR